ncbi:hypothetical protein SH2C18_43740 [Clostridium sediminicola]|uniref:holin n=1 Tax=Clostridium sediminicola TaxID=3114879 RepID=UPI0031F20948
MTIEPNVVVFIPVLVTVVEIFKKAGLPKKFSPLVSLFFGVIIGILLENSGDIKKGILNGIIIGTSSSGLYSSGKEIYKLNKK